jgi:hypothetical protein
MVSKNLSGKQKLKTEETVWRTQQFLAQDCNRTKGLTHGRLMGGKKKKNSDKWGYVLLPVWWNKTSPYYKVVLSTVYIRQILNITEARSVSIFRQKESVPTLLGPLWELYLITCPTLNTHHFPWSNKFLMCQRRANQDTKQISYQTCRSVCNLSPYKFHMSSYNNSSATTTKQKYFTWFPHCNNTTVTEATCF